MGFNDNSLPVVKPSSAPEAQQNCICYYHKNLNLISCTETPVNLLQPIYTQTCLCRPGLENGGEKWMAADKPTPVKSCLTAELLSLLWGPWALSLPCSPRWRRTWAERRITCISKHSPASRRVAVLQIGRRFAAQEGVIPLVFLPSAANSLGQCK